MRAQHTGAPPSLNPIGALHPQYNCTPLHRAADNGKVDCLKALLQGKADPNAKDTVKWDQSGGGKSGWRGLWMVDGRGEGRQTGHLST